MLSLRNVGQCYTTRLTVSISIVDFLDGYASLAMPVNLTKDKREMGKRGQPCNAAGKALFCS